MGCISQIANSVRCCCWYVPMGPSIVTIQGCCYQVMLMQRVRICTREGRRGGGGLSKLMYSENRCLLRRRFMSFRFMRYVQSRTVLLHIPHLERLLCTTNLLVPGCFFPAILAPCHIYAGNRTVGSSMVTHRNCGSTGAGGGCA